MAVGYVNSFPYETAFKKSMLPLRSINKIADDEDIKNQIDIYHKEKESENICKELIEKYQLNDLAQRNKIEHINLLTAHGCQECSNTGYKGRMAVIEYLRSDHEIRSIPKDEQFITKAKAYNASIGGRNLLEDGLLKAMTGLTTIDEIIRVCG